MPRKLDAATLYGLLMDREETPGLFTMALGFRTSTTGIKGVHLMNDLAQTVLGDVASIGGDLLCHVIREDKIDGEDNTDATLRAHPKVGPRFARAFPEALHPAERSRLRSAIGLVLNHDSGMFKPGDRMASGLATTIGLLGAEGFRRFQLGRHLAELLGAEGQARVAELYLDANDPIARALRPVSFPAPGRPPGTALAAEGQSAFDRAAGARLATLLRHPLSKPALLRGLLLGATLVLTLKVLGIGRRDGFPVALASAQDEEGRPALRQEAVQAFRLGINRMDAHLATLLPHHPLAAELWSRAPAKGAPSIEVEGDLGSLEEAAPLILREARRAKKLAGKDVYWPDEFVVALGRKAGCILPKQDRAGWGRRISLTPDLIEVLILMFSEPGAPPRPWRDLWADVRRDLGLVIGANELSDATFLEDGGLSLVSVEDLADNAEIVLELGARRGVARRLPDAGAEAGGGMQ